jgi:hypothetical protein
MELVAKKPFGKSSFRIDLEQNYIVTNIDDIIEIYETNTKTYILPA